MEEKYKLNDGHIIEAVDRIYIAQQFIESTLSEHALIDAVPEFISEVEKISNLLGSLYQQVAEYNSVLEISEKHEIHSKYTT